MKKIVVLISAILISVSSSQAALTLDWGTTANLLTPVGSWNGVISAGWLVQLYRDVGGDGLGSLSMANDGSGTITGDTLLASWTQPTVVGKAGRIGFSVTAQDGSSIAGFNVYTVIFNNAAIASATQYVVMDSATHALPASGTDTYSMASPANGWTNIGAVPEPSSLALIGVGLAAIALRRRFAK